MKKLILTLAILVPAIITLTRWASPKPSVSEIARCGVPADQQFAGFVNDPQFVNKHENPLLFQDFTPKGKMIQVETADGKNANAYFIESTTPTKDYLFVIHEWWGLNNYVKQESDRLSETLGSVNVIALDLYDGNVANTREDAARYMQATTTERARTIIQGFRMYAGADAKIFTIGWCFGGGWSLQAAIEVGNQAAGSVMFYGMPETDMDRLATLQCDVLGLFAGRDPWITPAVVSQFEANMKTLNKKVTIKSYDSEHAFANPSNPVYDKAASEDAYNLVFEFIKARK